MMMISTMATIGATIAATGIAELLPKRTETRIIIKVRTPEENFTQPKKGQEKFLKDLQNKKKGVFHTMTLNNDNHSLCT